MPPPPQPVAGVSFAIAGVSIDVPLDCSAPALVSRMTFGALLAALVVTVLVELSQSRDIP